MHSGQRVLDCELSSIDTALLIAGVLTAAGYFSADTPEEREIRELADLLYRRVDWQWMRGRKRLMCHGWKPGKGFPALALGRLRRGLDPLRVWRWARQLSPSNATATMPGPSTYEWKSVYGIDYLYAGPLFIHQMSHIWLDLRGIRDDFMRAHDLDYFENSRRATYVQQRYAIENPLGFPEYGALCWGITASDGPGPATRKIDGIQRKFYDYVGRGAPYGPDDGTLAPWAVAASLPFAPEIVLPSIEHYQGLHLCERNPYGFKASFSTVFQYGKAGPRWVSPYHFGINEGPTVIMVENHLHDFPWRLMRDNSRAKERPAPRGLCRWLAGGGRYGPVGARCRARRLMRPCDPAALPCLPNWPASPHCWRA